MNWDNVKELVNINFLYANPQLFAQIRAKQMKNPKKSFSALKSLRNQFLLVSFIYLLVYSVMFIGVDYRQSAGYFSVQMGLFSLIAFATGFNSLFSVFYDSKDTKIYLALPVTAQEVYLSKLLSAQPAILSYLMPLLALLGLAYWQLASPLVAILLTLPIFFLLLLMVNALSLVLLDVIGEVLVRSRHKKLISTALVMLSSLLSIGLIFVVQFNSNARFSDSGGLLMTEVPYFIGFYRVVLAPFSGDSLLQFWLPLLVLCGLIGYIIKRVIPKYFDQLLQMDAKQAQTKQSPRQLKKAYQERSFAQTLVRHHLGTIKDGTLLTQVYLMPMIFGFSGLMPFLVEGRDLSDLSGDYYGIALLLGLLMGLLSGAMSLLSVGISLEREQFNFIRTLPINFLTFLKSKFYTLLVVQVAPILVVHLLAGCLVFHLSPALLLAYAIGNLASNYLMGLVMYRRDYRLLELNWQNVTQLFSRGGNQWFLSLIYLGLFVGGIVLIAGAVVLSFLTSPQLVSGVLSLLALIGLLAGYWFLGRGFWKQVASDETGQ